VAHYAKGLGMKLMYTDVAITEAKKRAEELKKKAQNEEIVDMEYFQAELARSITRASVGDKWKVRKYRR
jgi:phage terminase Nu1 subunit (DNA packaging protein)